MANNFLLAFLPGDQIALSQALGLIIYYYGAKPSENETCANLLNGTLSIEDARALVNEEEDPGFEGFDGECLNFATAVDDTPSGDWLCGNIVINTAQQAIWDECLAVAVARGAYYWRALTPNGGNLIETNHPTIGVVDDPIVMNLVVAAMRDWEPT